MSTGQPGGPRAAPGLAGTQEVKMYFLTEQRKGPPGNRLSHLTRFLQLGDHLSTGPEKAPSLCRPCSLRLPGEAAAGFGGFRTSSPGPVFSQFSELS